MKRFFLTVTFLILQWSSFAAVASEAEILQAEQRFAQAIESGSASGLQAILSPDFLYQHTTGNTYTRADIVRIFSTREITVTRSGPLDVRFRDYGDTVVSYGTRWVMGELKGAPYAGTLRFVNVWHREPGSAWQLVHRNSELVSADTASPASPRLDSK